jgi:hypothetical protein
LEEKQDVVSGQTSPGKHVDREDVDARQHCHVGGMNSFPVVFWQRFGAGAMPYRLSTFATV